MKKYTDLVTAFSDVSQKLEQGIVYINSPEEEYYESYNEAYMVSRKCLFGLQKIGMKKGDKLIFQLDAVDDFIHIFWACILGGIIPVPISVATSDENYLLLYNVWEKVENSHIVCNEQTIENFKRYIEKEHPGKSELVSKKFVDSEMIRAENSEGIIAKAEPSDITMIQFSSGSTGTPKGVEITHENLMLVVDGVVEKDNITDDEVLMNWLPLTHNLGLIVMHILPLVKGLKQYIMPKSLFVYNPVCYMNKISQHHPTITASPNFGFKYLASIAMKGGHSWDLSSIRIIWNGAEPIDAGACDTFSKVMEAYGLHSNVICPGYGMTEATVVITVLDNNKNFVSVNLDRSRINIGEKVEELSEVNDNTITFVEVGSALPACKVRICNDVNEVMGEYVIGHIQVCGKTVMSGYYKDAEATKEVFSQDGWLKTGDIGYLRDGNLVITGRAKELILINGQNYYPHDIDRLCEQVEGIKSGKVAACGVYNKNSKEDSIAVFIEDKLEEKEFAELSKKVKVYLNSHGIWNVDFVTLIDSIPKTDSGKIKRNELKKRFENDEFNFDHSKKEELVQLVHDTSPIENKLLRIFKVVADNGELDIEDSFFSAGLSSLQLIKIVELIKEEFNAPISITDLFAYSTILKLADYLYDLENTVVKSGKTDGMIEEENEQDVAIIGIDCRFPGANSAKEYWMNLKAGIDCIGEYPEDRKNDVKDYINVVAETFTEKDMVEGGYLDEISGFDYSFFKITPKEAQILNPCQRLFLQSAYKALEEAGYVTENGEDDKIGVYVGASKSIFDYERLTSLSIKDNHSDYAIGNLYSMISGRTSYTLDLKGPSITMDTACSSSLVAVHSAYKAILNGECNMAVAGGVKINLLPIKTKIGIEASDSRAKVFDDSSDGTGCGEGVGVIILKSLKQAKKDHDNIYAVIKGSAINQDGKTAGITAPNSLSQTELLCDAWENAKIDPASLSYIETHGTGTKLGDPIEIDGICKAFARYTDKKEFCRVGSVKANIGHLFEAAGIAGVIKVALMEKYGMIPPLVHFKKLNHRINMMDSPLSIADKLQKVAVKGSDFRCGISSFGFSGTNCHVVLEGYQSKELCEEKKSNILTLSAKTKDSLMKLVESYINFLQEDGALVPVENICYMTTSRRKHYNYRLAIVIRNREELLNKLNTFLVNGKEDVNDLIYYGVHKVVNDESFDPKDFEISRNERAKLGQEVQQKIFDFENEEKMEEYFAQLADYYVKGAPISWSKIYSDEVYSKVSTPTYVFEKSRCWMDYTGENSMEEIGINEKYEKYENTDVLTNKIISLVCSVSGLKEQEVDIYEQFIGMGIDSMGLMQLKNSIRNIYKIDIPVNELFQGLSSVAKLTEYLGQNITMEEHKYDKKEYEKEIAVASTEVRQEEKYNNVTFKSNLIANEEVKTIMEGQLEVMKLQLQLLGNVTPERSNRDDVNNLGNTQKESVIPEYKSKASTGNSSKIITYRPYHKINFHKNENMSGNQVGYLEQLIEDFCNKTAGSKNNIQNYRKVYANNRNVAGFRPVLKEMVYQLVSPRAKGSKIWDVDGNEYIDLTMGFGVNLFGHNPKFVTDALGQQLDEGFSLGPMSHLAGSVADKICKMTGVDRVAFYNSGTEANMVALRIARAVTSRDKVVIFAGSYHGTFDGVLGVQGIEETDTLTMAPGVLQNMVKDLYVLDYGTEASLSFIQEHMDEIAAVMVEPVQSRRPDFRPVEFIHKLRDITEQGGTALIFDEVITGFRICNGGAQEWYGIKADIVTYGKIVGGGMPIGIVSGKSRFLDSIDGGYWSFGDQSCPPNEEIRTFVAGTFCHHPLAMAATDAVLTKLAEGNAQDSVNQRTEKFVNDMNRFFENEEVPIEVVNYGSLFRFVLHGDFELFYYILVTKGVYVWEGRNCFFSTEHTEFDIERLKKAIFETIYEMKENEFIAPVKKKAINNTDRLSSAQKESFHGIAKSSDDSLISNAHEFYPVSSSQKEIFISALLDPLSTKYNINGAILIDEDVDGAKLCEAIRQIEERHDILRSSFFMQGEDIYQRVNEVKAVEITEFKAESLKEAEELVHDFIQPFYLEEGYLFRVLMIRLSASQVILFCDMHHIVADGTSSMIFLDELLQIYHGAQLKPLKITYKDYSVHMNQMLLTEQYNQQKEYWLKEYRNPVTKLRLPFCKKDVDAAELHSSNTVFVYTDEELSEKIAKVAEMHSCTVFIVMLAAYQLLISRYTNTDDVILAVPFDGRGMAETDELIGMFVNTLYIRNEISGDQLIHDYLETVKCKVIGAMKNQDYSAEKLINEIHLERDGKWNALTHYLFSMQRNIDEIISLYGKQYKAFDTKVKGVDFDIAFSYMTDKNRIKFIIDYDRGLYEEKDILVFAERYMNVLNNLIVNQEKTIRDIGLLSKAEETQILNNFCRKATEFEDAVIKDLFESQAAVTPYATAITYRRIVRNKKFIDENMSYQELNEDANRLARILQQENIGEGDSVGIIFGNSIDLLIAVLAIFKVGAAYLPLHPEFPAERMKYMMELTKTKYILTHQTELAQTCIHELQDICDFKAIDVKKLEQIGDGSNLNLQVAGNSIAYTIFTSGTTGNPKGVQITHQSIGKTIAWRRNEYNFNKEDNILQLFSYAFDGFLTSALTPIISGSRLVLLDQEHIKDPLSIIDVIKEKKVSHFIVVPTLFSALLSVARKEELESLRIVTLAGERVTGQLIIDCKRLNPNIELVNEYGPTENTIVATIKHDLCENEKITIGKAVCGSAIFIVDKYMNLQPVGLEGEICISGERLAKGYLQDKENTISKFIPNPFMNGDIVYRTGDIGKWTEEGDIDFIGRDDSQIKIRGYRVELSEIENRILEYKEITNCAVLASMMKEDKYELFAYYVADREVTSGEIKQYLKQYLPNYMIPAFMVQIDKIFYTTIGKVDRKKLLDLNIKFNNELIGEFPKTQNESFLSSVWKKVLGMESVYVDQNFFEIGGDSIKAIQVVALCRQQGVELYTSDIMQKQTIRDIALCMKRIDMTYMQEPVIGEVNYTPIQKWFMENVTVDREYFNQTVLLENKKGYQLEGLEKVMQELVKHHDALRMSYRIKEDELLQKNENYNEDLVLLEYKDVTQIKNYLEHIYNDSNEIQSSFNLNDGQMMKAKVYHAEDRDFLFIAIHHLVIDGISWRILLEDLTTAYEAVVYGSGECSLPKKTSSFKEWAKALHQYAKSYQVEQEIDYWRKMLQHDYIPLLKEEIPYGFVRDEKKYDMEITLDESKEILYEINKAYGTNTQEIVFSAFARALMRTFGQKDYLIDLESHGREEIDSRVNVVRTVGWFTVQYPIGIFQDELQNIRDAIINVKEKFRRVPKNGIGYGLLKYLNKIDDLPEANSDIVFNFLGQVSKGKESDEIQVVEFNYGKTCSENQARHHLIEFDVIVEDDILKTSITYSGEVIHETVICSMANTFLEELGTIKHHCKEQREMIKTPADYQNGAISMEELQSVLKKYDNNVEKIYELTPMQKGMVFDYRMNPKESTYFEQIVLELEGQVDEKLLEKSFQIIIDRNDALRTCYNYEECCQPQQIVLKNYTLKIEVLDITNIKENPENFLQKFCADDITNGFSTLAEVPMRMYILKDKNSINHLVWSFHHIMMDGWCIDLILEELIEIYSGMRRGNTIQLPEAPSYSEYINWIKSKNEKAAFAYWKEYLKGYEEVCQTKLSAADGKNEFKREECRFTIDHSYIQALTKIAENSKITMATLFQTLWGVLLGKYSGKNEIVYGVVVSGRNPEIKDVERVVGLFINTLPIKIQLYYEASFIDIAKRVQTNMEKGNEYSYLSLAQIQSLSQIKGELFDNMLSFENYANYNNYHNRLAQQEKLGFKLNKVTEFEQTHFNLTFIIEPREQCYEVNLIYNSNTCDRKLIHSVEEYLVRIMKQLIDNNQINYGDIALGEEQEIDSLLYDFMMP